MTGFGGHYASSSTSTLSPTAPPFTVDRTASRPTLSPPPPAHHDPYNYYALPSDNNWLHLHPPPSPPYAAFPHRNSDAAAAADSVYSGGHGHDSVMGDPPPLPSDPSHAGDSENRGTPFLSSPLASSLVQAEPYYPHYSSTATLSGGGVPVSGGHSFEGSLPDLGGYTSSAFSGRCLSSPWNRPFDGEPPRAGPPVVDGGGNRSSWLESKDKAVASDCKVFSQPDGSTPEAFVAFEQGLGCWSGKYTDSVERRAQLGSGRSTLLDDKPPPNLEESVRAPFNVSEASFTTARVLNEGKIYPHSSDHDAFMEAGSTFFSNPSYHKNILHLDSYRIDPITRYPATSYSSPAHGFGPSTSRTSILMDENMPKDVTHCAKDVDPYNNCGKYMDPVSVEIKQPIVNLNTEGVDTYPGKGRMKSKAGNFFFLNSSAVRITSPSNLESTTANGKSSSGIILDSKIPNLKLSNACIFAPGFGESCDPKQSSSETLDQLNLSVDSPCWKGASYSQRSPFSADETIVISSHIINKKNGDADKERSDCLKLENRKRPQCSSGSEEEMNEVMLSEESKRSSKSKDHDVMLSYRCESSGTSASEPLFVAGTANFETDGKSPVRDCSSNFCTTIRDQASNSSSSVSCVPGEIVKPLGTSYPSSKCLPVGIDIQLVAQIMHNLSELLLSSCNVDRNALKGHDRELLQLAIDNLHMYLLKKVIPMGTELEQAPHFCSSHPNKNLSTSSEGTTKSKFQVMGLEAVDIPNQGDRKSIDTGEAKMRSTTPCMETIKAHNLVSTTDDVNFNSKGMTQLLEKVMKENIHEQLENPQTLLFKNLWIEAEVALCSLRYELQLAKSKFMVEKCLPQLTEDFHGSLDVEGKASNVLKSSIFNSTNDLDEDSPSLPKAGESSSQVISPIRKVESQSTHLTCHESIPSSVYNKSKEIDAAVMARLKVLKGRIDIDGESTSAIGNACASGKDESRSNCLNCQETIPSSTNNTKEEIDTSIMARLKAIEGRIKRVDSTRVDEQQRLPDTIDVGSTMGTQETTHCPSHADTGDNAEINSQETIDAASMQWRNPWLFHRHRTGNERLAVSSRPGNVILNQDVGFVSEVPGEVQETLVNPTFAEWRNPWLFHRHETGLDSNVSGEFLEMVDDPPAVEWRNPWLCPGRGPGGGRVEVSSRSGAAAYNEDIGVDSDVSGGLVMTREFHACTEDRPGGGLVFQPYIPNSRPGRQLLAGGHDSSSSDWEHVLKEELTW